LIELAQNDSDIADCFPAMHQLRTELAEDKFVDLVKTIMRDGFQLAALRDNDRVVCVAGFRISHNLVHGKHLYVDDLSTLADARSKGFGSQMISWLRNLARSEGCNVLHLDSGVQRHAAHKFYLNQNMSIVSHHFAEKIS